jgi:hypothetical protein
MESLQGHLKDLQEIYRLMAECDQRLRTASEAQDDAALQKLTMERERLFRLCESVFGSVQDDLKRLATETASQHKDQQDLRRH